LAHIPPAPAPPRSEHVDTLHGVDVADPYRALEDADAPEVQAWVEAMNARYVAATDALPQRQALARRFEHLWRYDDESTPRPSLLSDAEVYSTKRADQDKWVVWMRPGPGAPGRVVLDPNTWGETDTLAEFTPSPDCRYAAFGRASAGDENPVLAVLDLTTLETLPDTCAGWKQRGVSWLHDGSGFFYSGKPAPGTVEPGEENYWHRVWFHRLGTTAEHDVLVWHDPATREVWHSAEVSEDGRYVLWYRSLFNRNAAWITDLRDGPPGSASVERQPVVTEFDRQYLVEVFGDRLLILTDWGAPHYRLMATSVSAPARDWWVELVPEHPDDVLAGFDVIGGRLYLSYRHRASTRIAIHDAAGQWQHDMTLPGFGQAQVWGLQRRPTVWMAFSSFVHPSETYTYDPGAGALTRIKASPIDIDTSGLTVDQVDVTSRDGTSVSMFLVRGTQASPANGPHPVLLTGYGGFNVSLTPNFATLYAVWVESGGVVAIPNLRGGGEYGRAWHEAGMRGDKQNVFDDFIAAAEWLVASGWTTPRQLAIRGGSNGGLLVSAVMAQRPELFGAVHCAVPLTDMLRFHHFGIAAIWTEEYGSPEDAAAFRWLRAYSPYHNLDRAAYPPTLVVGSANDARTDPVHARKFAAALLHSQADADAPVHLFVQAESGHGGGVTIRTQVDQTSRSLAFVMDCIGMGGGEDE
jgi:prolyl oligopeptidase